MTLRRGDAALLLALVCLQASAGTDPLPDSLRGCGREADQTKRLACFDALVKTLPTVEADQFGLTADIAHKRDPVAKEPVKSAALPGKIVALGQTASGRWIFTLDNHQVWVQAEVQPSLHFDVGESVQIEHGAMSSLWLAAPKNRKTRVKRVE
jgi:hypothetical protein